MRPDPTSAAARARTGQIMTALFLVGALVLSPALAVLAAWLALATACRRTRPG